MTTEDRSAALSAAAPADLLRILRRLVAEGRVAIHADPRRLQHMDSPVVVEADANLWIYAAVAAVLLAWWAWGNLWALGTAAIGMLAYFTLGRRYVERRLERRVRQVALEDSDTWRRLWRLGGVRLAAPGEPDCEAPDGNWMAFVRRLAAVQDPPSAAAAPAKD
jgi:hypothetical protein